MTTATTSLLTNRLKKIFKDYDSFHGNRSNQLSHFFGIPMIVVAIFGLLARVYATPDIVRWDLGIGLWFLALVFYLILDWKLAVPFGLFSLGLYFLGRAASIPVLIALFIVGWGLQFWGHYKEKKNPAFFKNVSHLLIGPLWIFAKILGYR